MERLREEFLDKVEIHVPLDRLKVLEIGCGTGSRSVAIAKRCQSLTAIEPDKKSLEIAISNSQAPNITFQSGEAQKLNFPEKSFDVSMFTLSLHHVPISLMGQAIDEAIRVTRKDGYVIFLEPAFLGTFFEAELQFDACDGDERAAKARAYFEILSYKNYTEIAEMTDETVFKLDSVEDFVETFDPKENLEQLPAFLGKNNFILNAERRINIFQV